MPELTSEQQQAFDDRLRELGMDQSHVVPSLRTSETPGPTYLSNHPEQESEIAAHAVTIDNVDDLKRLAGVPDEEYEAGRMEHHHDELEEWPQHKNDLAAQDLAPEENHQLRQALAAHVFGHSERVASYTAALNNQFFPMEAVAWAVLDVTVDPEHPLILKGNNQAYNFGTVTIKRGGQIVFDSDATMTCQVMVLE
jgi:hypothetical protein